MLVPTAAVRRRTVFASDGTRISVLVATPPQGIEPASGLPPVLAVHGFASSATGGWRRTGHLDALTRAGRTVIAPDLRGHGSSDRPHAADAYTLPTMLADLVAAYTAVTESSDDIETTGQVDLLGYSLGARLCWALSRERLLPVRRMVLGGFDGRPLFQGVDTGRLERMAADAGGNDLVALHNLVVGLAGTGGTPADGSPPAIAILLVAGERDTLAGDARTFAASLPNGSFLQVPGRNHVSAVTSSTFRRGVVDFLAGADPVRTSVG